MPSIKLVSLKIQLPGPLDVAASIERFRRWGDDLLDRWDGEVWIRGLRLAGEPVAFTCKPSGSLYQPSLTVSVAREAHLAPVIARARRMFVTHPLEALVAADPVIADLAGRFPGIRPVIHPDPFTAIIVSISAQQVNLRWAATTRRRLAESFGTPLQLGEHVVMSLDPHRIAGLKVTSLRALQFTTRKAEYIIGLARAVVNGSLNFEVVAGLADDEVIARLTAIRGLGRWSAEWFLARVLGRARVVAGDLGVRKAVGRHYCGGDLPSEHEVRELTAHWGPAAGVAQQLLLHDLGAGE